MKYIGLQTQIWRNNTKSIFLLLSFPTLFLSLVWIFLFIFYYNQELRINQSNSVFIQIYPYVLLAIFIWFLIAWRSHNKLIRAATQSKTLERKNNLRVYNLVENLCISRGIRMPKINIIDDDSLNAFASGIDNKSYTITLSRGIIDKLNDEELEGVIAHELTHIINRDVRLLMISIIFVGIFSFIIQMANSISKDNKKGNSLGLLILVSSILGFVFAKTCQLALSRKREFLADAGAAELTKNPLALASALRKISIDPRIEAVKRRDVAQLFIENPTRRNKSRSELEGINLPKKHKTIFLFIYELFSTHPPIQERIDLLEQF